MFALGYYIKLSSQINSSNEDNSVKFTDIHCHVKRSNVTPFSRVKRLRQAFDHHYWSGSQCKPATWNSAEDGRVYSLGKLIDDINGELDLIMKCTRLHESLHVECVSEIFTQFEGIKCRRI